MPERCCWQDSLCGPRRGGNASRTQTCAKAELLLARCSRPLPTSQTCVADRFRSRAELLLARSRSLRFSSRSLCCWRLRSTMAALPSRRRSIRNCGSAICGSCPDSSADIPDQRQSSGGDNRRAVAAGTPVGCRRIAPAETSMVGRPAHNSDTAVRPYRRCRTNDQTKNLETI